jgi:hypothetical protein
MDIDQQIKYLIENAPQDGRTGKIVQAIAPALKYLALQLRHPQYYIRALANREWLLTTLSNRANPGVEKRVIYAYPTLQDVHGDPNMAMDQGAIALPVPVTHILFQMVAMDRVNSIVFFETPGNLTNGTEVKRDDMQQLIQLYLQQGHLTKPAQSNNLPPDIA